MALSKNKLKWINALTLKKYRDADNCFIAEGPKVVEDLASRFRLHTLLATETYLPKAQTLEVGELVIVSQQELEKASQLKTPHDCLAIFEKPTSQANVMELMPNELALALDGVQDPGNLGTIIRLADWFGISHIYCSAECADAFSPKTVQATMGALARVACHYVELPKLIASLRPTTPIYGTFLEGDDLYEKDLRAGGLLIMGNEGRGISPEIAELVTERLFIPNYPFDRSTSESLNVAVATSIACAEFRRQVRKG